MELIFDGIKGKAFYLKDCCWQDAKLQFLCHKNEVVNPYAKGRLLVFNA